MQNNVHITLEGAECDRLQSLQENQDEVDNFEKETKAQSATKLWYKARASRIAASSVSRAGVTYV